MGTKVHKNSSDDDSWLHWTESKVKESAQYAREVRKNVNRGKAIHKWGRRVGKVARPAARRVVVPAGRKALQIGGRAIVKFAPRIVATAAPEVASGLAAGATAAAPLAAVFLAAAAMTGAVEHFGVRTYIENEMRWIRGIKEKAPPPRW